MRNIWYRWKYNPTMFDWELIILLFAGRCTVKMENILSSLVLRFSGKWEWKVYHTCIQIHQVQDSSSIKGTVYHTCIQIHQVQYSSSIKGTVYHTCIQIHQVQYTSSIKGTVYHTCIQIHQVQYSSSINGTVYVISSGPFYSLINTLVLAKIQRYRNFSIWKIIQFNLGLFFNPIPIGLFLSNIDGGGGFHHPLSFCH